MREHRDALARRIDDVLGRERDESEACSAALTAALAHTVSAALLLEQSAGDVRKGLVALRYARRHLLPGSGWDDHIAVYAGREMLGYEAIDAPAAAKAAA